LQKKKEENFEDTKEIIRSREPKKDRQYNEQKRTQGQTLIYKIPLMI